MRSGLPAKPGVSPPQYPIRLQEKAAITPLAKCIVNRLRFLRKMPLRFCQKGFDARGIFESLDGSCSYRKNQRLRIPSTQERKAA